MMLKDSAAQAGPLAPRLHTQEHDKNRPHAAWHSRPHSDAP